MTPDIEESIRCTVSSCSCVCFKPVNTQLRSCDRCGHGWVAHALEKLQAQPPSSCGPVEVALPGLVLDLSSLILYGAQAIPVRLKILLDRLYSILTPEQVRHILHTLGWSLGDYVRGYMLQYPSGKVLNCWLMVTQEEELLILKQFLRFGETRNIVELMTPQCFAAASHFSDPDLNPIPKSCQSNISTFTEQNGRTPGVFKNSKRDSCVVSGICHFEKNNPADHDTVQRFESFPGRLSLLQPVNFPDSAVHCLVPSTKELVSHSKPAQYLRKHSGTTLTERHRHEAGRGGQENDPILPQSKGELALKIKVDPDKPNPLQSLWHQSHHFPTEPGLHRGVTKPENASSSSPTLNSSLYPPISSPTPFPLKNLERLQDSSSPSLHPLPSFSSSFLCPSPTPPFSSTLHPLPSSICSLPSSPAVGRKGRVGCGVCGKSFYDKGTLKIHYNAVHLKIKHRCTVAGCTMVFSSLRSRNRHSANPNPRLHTNSNRDTQIHRNSETHIHEAKQARKNIHNTDIRMCREKKVCITRWQHENDAHVLKKRCGTISRNNSPPPSPHPLLPNLEPQKNFTTNDFANRSNLHRHAAPPAPLLPAHCTSSLVLSPSFVPLVVPVAEKSKHYQRLLNHTSQTLLSDSTPITLVNCKNQSESLEYSATEGKLGDICTSPVINQQKRLDSGDPMPKKKPRKSSTPVKIEREKPEKRRNKEEQEGC